MCVGIKVEEPFCGKTHLPFEKLNTAQSTLNKPKRRNNEERKEKAKDAARNRRTEESDYFEELEKLLPVTGPPPSSQQTTLDKTSIIRLSVAHLKTQDVLRNGLKDPIVKEEIFADLDLFSCLDGFNLVLSSRGDVIHVSENVTKYIGLTQVELLGQDFSEYVHPCDHSQLKLLTPNNLHESEDEIVEIFVRVKCTVTERGRMINLKQASYKPLKISGKARLMNQNEVGGISGPIFLGLASCVIEREVMVDNQIGVFTTKHSVDMKFMESNHWLSNEAGYSPSKLIGVSFFELVHAQDIQNVQMAFKNLKEHGQCETAPYRLLCSGGGYCWITTKACVTTARRGCNKGPTISCSHHQISELMNKDELLSIIQMKAQNYQTSYQTQAKDNIAYKKDIMNEVTRSMQDNLPSDSMKFELIEEPICNIEISVPSIQKSVIIEPRQIHGNDYPAIKADETKKISATPTSVIVKCRQPEPSFETVPLTQKSLDFLKENDCHNTKPATEGIWKKSDAVAIATESIFGNKETVLSSAVSEEIFNSFFPVKNVQEEVELKEPDIFDDLFTNIENLEQFAPHSGDQCILIDKENPKPEQPAMQTVNFDEMILLDFDHSFELANEFGGFSNGKPNETIIKDFMAPDKPPTFDEEQVLIDPKRNAMWGSNGGGERCSEHSEKHLQSHEHTPVPTIWVGQKQANRNMLNSTTNQHSEFLHPKKGVSDTIFNQTIFDRSPETECLEPPDERITCRPKMEAIPGLLKRSYPSQFVAPNSVNKRLRLDAVVEPSREMNHIGFLNMANLGDIEVVTIT